MPGPNTTKAIMQGGGHISEAMNSGILRQTWTSIEPGSVVHKSKNSKLSAQHQIAPQSTQNNVNSSFEVLQA